MSELTPIVLACACSNFASRKIIEGIVRNESSKSHIDGSDGGRWWRIVNKYYTANIYLQPFIDGQNSNDVNKNAVEAVLIYVNNSMGESLVSAQERVRACKQFIDKSEMNILVCDSCDATFPQEQATAWCLENDFELIQLSEKPEAADETCLIQDHYGMERVIHTLHTNMWSNQQMHDQSSHDVDKEELNSEDEDDLEHMDQFCKLFSQLPSVTQNVPSMPSEGRKVYAEQVVKAFWKAIGGDESELEDANA